MFGDKKSYRAPEDPAVALVESILGAAAAPIAIDATPTQGSRVTVRSVLRICACVTIHDAPTWLIYDGDDGGIGWCRFPDGVDAEDFVDARLWVGGHADPDGVLLWLQGKAADPWQFGGDGWGAVGVLDDLQRKILQSST